MGYGDMYVGEFRFLLFDFDVLFLELFEIFKLYNLKIELLVFFVCWYKLFVIFLNCWNFFENKIEMKLNFEFFELEW